MTRILIADDHEIVRRGLKDILTAAFKPVEIGEARDSRETIQRVNEKTWDALLLDINMPGRNGLEVLEEVKHLRPKMPVLVLSAYSEEDYAIRAFRLGASGYLSKRGASDELLVALRKAMTGGRYVSTAFAERLAATLGNDLRQEPHQTLSNRELQVLRMIAAGRTIKEIAAELSLSEKTVGTYRTRISEKMRLGTNVELTRYALQHGLAD
ncbi:MAG TPA: response regulator transcription factor [Candidatus Nitrosotalea sp.]|nr:response regulator transcription factor [Candidatus Nitrosotalea sp.]